MTAPVSIPKRWIALSLAALVLGALTAPRIVPLYDGVGFPDEPYRYVTRPKDTLPATTAIQTVPLQGVADSMFAIPSQEQGPQVSITLSARAVSAPSPATEVVIKAEPQAPSGQPASGAIAGNVYHVTATSTPGPPTIKTGDVTIALRLPQGYPMTNSPSIEYRPTGEQWRRLSTVQVGTDIYQARFAGLGDYAMVTGDAASAKSSWSPSQIAAVAAASVIVLIAILILALRRAERRRR